MITNNQKEKNTHKPLKPESHKNTQPPSNTYSHFVNPSNNISHYNNLLNTVLPTYATSFSDESMQEAFMLPREASTTQPFHSFFYSDLNYNSNEDPDKYSQFSQAPLLSSLSIMFNRSSSAPPDYTTAQNLVQRIDSEHPCSLSSEYKGEERKTVTPIGNHPFLREISTSERVDLEDELNELCDGHHTCVGYSMDQEGSRFMQKRLERATSKEMFWFFEQIKNEMKVLCLDLFGNYVVQKMLELEIGLEVVACLKEHVSVLSMHMYGCRVIQKIFDVGHGIFIMNYVKSNCRSLLEDQNGNHVLQKAVESNLDTEFILDEYKKDSIRLCKHKYGCRVIQRLFENSKDEDISQIVDKFANSIEYIIDDQYGNYVLQHIIETKPLYRTKIINAIIKLSPQKIFTLSTHKFASNVIEKCVIVDDNMDVIFLSVIKDRPMVVLLAADKFGNYVVQRIVDKRKNETVIEMLRKWGGELRKSVYAKHIFAKIS